MQFNTSAYTVAPLSKCGSKPRTPWIIGDHTHSSPLEISSGFWTYWPLWPPLCQEVGSAPTVSNSGCQRPGARRQGLGQTEFQWPWPFTIRSLGGPPVWFYGDQPSQFGRKRTRCRPWICQIFWICQYWQTGVRWRIPLRFGLECFSTVSGWSGTLFLPLTWTHTCGLSDQEQEGGSRVSRHHTPGVRHYRTSPPVLCQRLLLLVVSTTKKSGDPWPMISTITWRFHISGMTRNSQVFHCNEWTVSRDIPDEYLHVPRSPSVCRYLHSMVNK